MARSISELLFGGGLCALVDGVLWPFATGVAVPELFLFLLLLCLRGTASLFGCCGALRLPNRGLVSLKMEEYGIKALCSCPGKTENRGNTYKS